MAIDQPAIAPIALRQLIGRIDDRLRSLVTKPGLWGPPEAVELQVLQLLEIRALSHEPSLPRGEEKWIQAQWIRMIGREYPQALPGLLATWLVAAGRHAELYAVLDRLCVYAVHRMSTAEPVRFPRADAAANGPHYLW